MATTQLYAKIKRSSKYFYQNGWAKEDKANGRFVKVGG
jgi:hypothetical protein